MIRELYVGQKVYLKPVNSNRGNMITREISKIGRKYFEIIIYNSPMKFHLDSLFNVCNYDPDWKVYFSEQDILDEEEYNDIYIYLNKEFEWRNKNKLTIDQLRRIKIILEEGEHNG